MKKLLFGLAIISTLFACQTNTRSDANFFYPGKTWYDTDSVPIEAHACGILKIDDIYYMYGQDQRHGHFNKTGVCCYSSKDLFNWKYEGTVLPSSETPELYQQDGNVLERPKVIHNKKTGKFIMWMHLDANKYSTAEAGVAISDSPTDTFKFLKAFRPIKHDYGFNRMDGGGVPKSKEELDRISKIDEAGKGNTFRDMNLFVDDDGTAYVIYSSEMNSTIYIVKLSEDYTDIARPVVEGETWSRAIIDKKREAPAPFKYKNKYYIITSGLTGWSPNPAAYHTADNMLGPWTTFENPCVGPNAEITFGAQSTFVLHAPGKTENCFIFMSDIWDGNKLQNSKLMWLPFYIKEDGSFEISFLEKWNLDIFDDPEIMPGIPNDLCKDKESNKITWMASKNAKYYAVYEDDKLIGQTSECSYSLPNYLAGNKHKYQLVAKTLFDKSSLKSKPIEVYWDTPTDCYLSDMEYDFCEQGWGQLQIDKALHGSPLKIKDQTFEKGFGSHAPTNITYNLDGNYTSFSVYVGVDAYTIPMKAGSAEFIIKLDEKEYIRSKIMTGTDEAKYIEVYLKGANTLELIATDANDGTHYDHVDFAEPKLYK